MPAIRLHLICLQLSLFLTAAGGLHADSASDIPFFETTIRPLLANQCYSCHGEEKQKGGLRLDHIDHIRAGGDHYGPAILPDQPASKSPLLLAVSYKDADLQMPPDEPLSPADLAALEKWISMGAPWPAETATSQAKYKPGTLGEEERAWWAFQPLAPVAPPAPAKASAVWHNEIDLFIQQKLAEHQLQPAPEASGEELLRRVYFDLHGLPPSPETITSFTQAYENAETGAERSKLYEGLIDELLASPRYGERWAQHWLDLARYAESDGYRQDAYRPNVWPYRNYVIQSFNQDKPYDQFIKEQIAGDEIAPEDPNVAIGTAFLRLGIYEYNQRDAEGQWKLIQNEVTDVTADVFLGLSVQCAQCHDHKFDPILQKDYYRLQAFLNNITWEEEKPLATEQEMADYHSKLKVWKEAAAEPLAVLDSILEPRIQKAMENAMSKFPEEVQAMYAKPRDQRSPYEDQVVQLAYRQAAYERVRFNTDKLPEPDATRYKEAKEQLKAFDHLKPKDPLSAFVIGETGLPATPASFITRKSGTVETQPGFLTILHPEDAVIPPTPPGSPTSGRRKVLADWLANPQNPLSTRVIVNRIWQYHFGRGIVGTASDFGRLGETPSHPELLDWLTQQFLDGGWRLKPLHKKILLSATYRQTARRAPDDHIATTDPENKWLWRFPPRRLSAEEIRDSALAATGELDFNVNTDSQDAKKPARSIYTKRVRNTQDEILRNLDAPAGYSSTPQRDATTTATQSLLLFNGDWSLDRARALSARLTSEHYNQPAAQIQKAYQLLFNRNASKKEMALASDFLREQTKTLRRETPPPPPVASPLADIHQNFPPAVTQIVKSDKSLNLQPGSPYEKLRVNSQQVEGERFFVEAVITLDSLYPDASVRTIVSRWNNGKTDPGWAFGVTSQKSAFQPNNLIMQLSGDDFQGSHAYEVVASGLRIPVGKAHYLAASVSNRPQEGQPYGGTITFYALDLTDPQAVMQSVTVQHEVVGGYIDPKRALVVGGRDASKGSLWQGGIAQVIVSNGVRQPEWKPMQQTGQSSPCIVNFTAQQVPIQSDQTFVWETGTAPVPNSKTTSQDPAREALTDLCHILINANEFVYLH